MASSTGLVTHRWAPLPACIASGCCPPASTPGWSSGRPSGLAFCWGAALPGPHLARTLPAQGGFQPFHPSAQSPAQRPAEALPKAGPRRCCLSTHPCQSCLVCSSSLQTPCSRPGQATSSKYIKLTSSKQAQSWGPVQGIISQALAKHDGQGGPREQLCKLCCQKLLRCVLRSTVSLSYTAERESGICSA